MKRLLAITLASTVALAMPVAALAQQAAPPAGPVTDTQNPPNDAGIQLGVPTGADVTWEQLLQHIAAPAAPADAIAGINESSNVQFIDIAKLPGVPVEGFDQQLQASLDTAGQSQTEMHSAIMANSFLTTKLMEGGYSIEDVVAWADDPPNAVFFYVRANAATQPGAAGAAAPAPGAAGPN